MNPSASSYSQRVDFAILFITIVGGLILLGLTVFMIFCVIRYSRKRNPTPARIDGSIVLEAIWTVIPTILVLIMFYLGYEGFAYMRRAPKNAMIIKVTARMWSWSFEYENGKKIEGDAVPRIKVPLGRPVKMKLESLDVIHSFFVPAFRNKEDVVPGMTNYLWFIAEETGVFDILCAEFCGDRHSYMRAEIEVVPPEEFYSWYTGKALPAKKALQGATARGQKIFNGVGTCMVCHSIDGSKKIGPTLQGIYGSKQTVITKGQERQITVDEEYLRQSILEPQVDIVKGYEQTPMTAFKGVLTDQDIADLIAYLKALK